MVNKEDQLESDMAEGVADVGLGVRQATGADAELIVELLALAFHQDPTWSWAFPDPRKRMDQHRALWSLLLHSALTYGWVWLTNDGGAVAVWIPPDKPEMSEADEARLEPLIRELLGGRADTILELFERFELHHPRQQPHFYLNFLATHPDHRGSGKGMRLLAENLAMIDKLGMPAYLESSNRSNDRRYERVGFVVIDEFSTGPGGPSVGCMWRDPQ